MKKEFGNKVKLGMLVILGLSFFIAGLYFIGQKQQLFNKTFRISGVFKDINGLQIGNNVRFSGINVGIVDDIQQINDSSVRINMLIEEDTRKFIKKDAKAIIGSDGLMGNKIVLIFPGTSNKQMVSDNDVIQTTQSVTIDEILEKIKTSSENTANITSDLSVIVNTIKEGKGTIGKVFMDTTFAKNVDEALVNIKQGAGGFKQNMAAARHNILLKGYFKKKENTKEPEEKVIKVKDK